MISVLATATHAQWSTLRNTLRNAGFRCEVLPRDQVQVRTQTDGHSVERAMAILAEGGATDIVVRDDYSRECVNCPTCRNYRNKFEFMVAPNGDPCCGNCFYNNYISCYATGEIVPRREAWLGPDDNYYSASYGPENFERCRNCNSQRDRANFIESVRRGRVCENCDDSPRDQPFIGSHSAFSAENTFGSSRSYGVELESNVGIGSRDYSFDGKYDGSIRGLEFVSTKLRGDEGLAEIRGFLEDSNGLRANRACGYHLHMNVRDMSDSQKYATFLAYVATQAEWLAVVDRTRNNNGYCRHLRASDFTDAVQAWREGRAFSDFAYQRDRYYWFNVQAISRHNTFENRLHHGTFDFNEIAGWIITNLRFTKKVKHLTVFNDVGAVTEDAIANFRTEARRALRRARRYSTRYLGVEQPVAA